MPPPLSQVLMSRPQGAPPQAPPQGGLAQAAGMPPQAMSAQGTQAAIGQANMEERVNQFQGATQTADEAFRRNLQQMALPSMEEAQRATRAAMERYERTMAPAEYSGFDNLMAGIAASPQGTQGLGAALGNMGVNVQKQRERFDLNEQRKAGAMLDQTQENERNIEAFATKAINNRAAMLSSANNLGVRTIDLLKKNKEHARQILQQDKTVPPNQLELEVNKRAMANTVAEMRGVYTDEQIQQLLPGLWNTIQQLPANTGQPTVQVPMVREEQPDVIPGAAPPAAPTGVDFNFDVTGWSQADRDALRKQIERYKANPNEGTRLQVEAALKEITGRAKSRSIPGEATQPSPFSTKSRAEIEADTAGKKKSAELKARLDVEQDTKSSGAVGDELGKAAGKAQAALAGRETTDETAIKHIDELLSHPGFESSVGATLRPFFKNVDGTPEAGFNVRLKQILGGSFLDAYEVLRGGGAITEIEGEKATQAKNRLNTSTSEEEFKAAAEDLKAAIRSGFEKLRKQAGLAGAQPTSQTPPRPKVRQVGQAIYDLNEETGKWHLRK